MLSPFDTYRGHILLLLLVFLFSTCKSMNLNRIKKLQLQTTDMFDHAFDNYMNFAFPKDELSPISCKGKTRDPDHTNWNLNDVLPGIPLTLIDSLDTILVIKGTESFHKAVETVIDTLHDFNLDSRVQVFEVTIRVLGGLLSAHLLLLDPEYHNPKYKNELLKLSIDLADRLLPAFDTPTKIPWPRVNLQKGVLPYESPNTCSAGASTLILEFGVLSRLTNNPTYERVAKTSLLAIFNRRSSLGIVGNSINVNTGAWGEKITGIGAGIDSFYEYLFKASILLGDEDDANYLAMFEYSMDAVSKWIMDPNGFIYKNIDLENGNLLTGWVDSLAAFWPGLLVLKGDLKKAILAHQFYFTIWRRFSTMFDVINIGLNGSIFLIKRLRSQLILYDLN